MSRVPARWLRAPSATTKRSSRRSTAERRGRRGRAASADRCRRRRSLRSRSSSPNPIHARSRASLNTDHTHHATVTNVTHRQNHSKNAHTHRYNNHFPDEPELDHWRIPGVAGWGCNLATPPWKLKVVTTQRKLHFMCQETLSIGSECHQIVRSLGLCPGPHWGSLHHSPRPI